MPDCIMSVAEAPPTLARLNRTGILICGSLLIVAIGLDLYPIRTGLIRLLLLVAWAGVWLGLAWMLRRFRAIAIAIVALPILAALLLALPGKNVDANSLRSGYLQALNNYEGVS